MVFVTGKVSLLDALFRRILPVSQTHQTHITHTRGSVPIRQNPIRRIQIRRNQICRNPFRRLLKNYIVWINAVVLWKKSFSVIFSYIF